MSMARLMVTALLLGNCVAGFAQQAPMPERPKPPPPGIVQPPPTAAPQAGEPGSGDVQAENLRLKRENLLLRKKIELLEQRLSELETPR